MKGNILKLTLLVCVFLGGCNNSTAIEEKDLEVCILKAYTNYGNSVDFHQTQPPELYYTIRAKNNKPSPLYLFNESSRYGEEGLIPSFQALLACSGGKVNLNLYNVASPITYLDSYAADTITIRAYFKEIRNRAKECGFEKVANFVKELVQEGEIIYLAQPSHGEIEKAGKSYFPIDSFSIRFDERSIFEVVQ